MHSATKGEKWTAGISTIVAVALLGAMVTASPDKAPTRKQIESLESDLRFQIDLSYRSDRAAYRDRLAELEQTLAAWRQSPRSDEDAQILAYWLRESTSRSLPGALTALPPTPTFGSDSMQSVKTPRSPVSPPPTAPDLTKPVVVGRAPLGESGAGVSARPSIGAAQATASAEVTSKPESSPQPPIRATVAGSEPMEKPTVTGSEADRPLATIAPANDASSQRSVAVVGSSTKAKPPAAASGQTAEVSPTGEGERPPRVARASVVLNLAELRARIGGYHDGLREIDSRMTAARDALPTAELPGLVDQVEQLANQYEFVRLYYESLTDDERTSTPAPRPMLTMVELLAREVARAARDGGDDFLKPFEADAGGGADLTRRLDAVAAALSRGENEKK